MALVDVSTLSRLLAGPAAPTVIDVRWALGGPPGRDGYLEGHLPGAAFLDLDRDLSGRPGPGGRHPLPEPGALQEALRAAGVRYAKNSVSGPRRPSGLIPGAGHPVVAYDAGDGMAAARLWWTLRWAGHPQVSVLDGGLAAWVAQGYPLEPGEVIPPPGDIVVVPGGLPVLTAEAAAELARAGVLLDARTPVRYRGEQEPVDPVAGHIPGAVNLPYAELVDASGRLRPVAEVVAAVEAAAGGTVRPGAVGAYCGSGVTAAYTVLALHEVGIDASLYVGSWSAWCADGSRPVARGEAP